MVSQEHDESIGHAVNPSSIADGLTYIEQLQIVASKPCTNEKSPYLIGVHNNDKKALLTKASCGLWSCEPCGFRNARRWIARILLNLANSEQTWSMLTITARRNARKTASVANLREGWKKLSNRIVSNEKSPKKNTQYVRVWEQHEDGSFHNHVLINCCFGTRWAKDNAAQCGLGYVADWRELENAGQAVGYVAKYTLKNATIARGGVLWPNGLRRIETTRNWPKLPDLEAFSEYSWNIANNREFQLHQADRLTVSGYQIIDLTEKKE
jgi:hypothetical protein